MLYEGRDAIMKLKNKKLLFLGTAAGAVSMVNYAKEQGAYVYVTDNLNVTPLSAKYYASEVLDYSTFDIDNLVKFARSNEIDGVLCGVSENNLVKVRELCDVLGLPCYFTKEQWDLCQDKKKFRELCLKYGVPCPKEYTLSEVRDNQVSFPIIIKPVDGFAGKGITICYDSQEFEDAYKLAINESKTKSVIIEDYVIGDEITAVYTIKDGEVSLSLFRDRYPSLDHENVTSQFDACLAPSVHYEKFMLNTNEGLKKLLKGIESTMGCVFFQGIATCDNVYIFECGYRMNALCDYNNIAKGTGLNYMHMLVDYSLNGDLEEYKLCRDNPFPEEYYCIFNMTAHGGTIGELNGLEQCLNIENVIYAEFLLPVGYTVIENNSMAQSVFRAYINTKDSYSMKETINKIQSVIEVLDINGMDMLFKKFDVNRLRFVDIERSESYE